MSRNGIVVATNRVVISALSIFVCCYVVCARPNQETSSGLRNDTSSNTSVVNASSIQKRINTSSRKCELSIDCPDDFRMSCENGQCVCFSVLYKLEYLENGKIRCVYKDESSYNFNSECNFDFQCQSKDPGKTCVQNKCVCRSGSTLRALGISGTACSKYGGDDDSGSITSLSDGAIAGIVIGIVLLGALTGLAVWGCNGRNTPSTRTTAVSTASPITGSVGATNIYGSPTASNIAVIHAPPPVPTAPILNDVPPSYESVITSPAPVYKVPSY